MKITKEMEDYFLRVGHPKEDLRQLKKAIREVRLTLSDKKGWMDDEKISNEQAVKVLGMETFLSGISRAAFHATCSRDTKDNKQSVSFSLLHWW